MNDTQSTSKGDLIPQEDTQEQAQAVQENPTPAPAAEQPQPEQAQQPDQTTAPTLAHSSVYHSAVIDVGNRLTHNLQLIKSTVVAEVDTIEVHLKRDLGFLLTCAQAFATRLMPAHQKEELMAWCEQVKERHGLL